MARQSKSSHDQWCQSGIDQRGSGVTGLRPAEVPSRVRRHSTNPGSPSPPLCPNRGSGLSRKIAKSHTLCSDGPGDSVGATKPTLSPRGPAGWN